MENKNHEITTSIESPNWHSVALCTSEHAISIIPLTYAEQNKILPISLIKRESEEILVIACTETDDEMLIKENLKLVTDKSIILKHLPLDTISKAIPFAYQKYRLAQQANNLDLEATNNNEVRKKGVSLTEEKDRLAPILLQTILIDAIEKRASDIHLDNCDEHLANINFRIDGHLVEQTRFRMSNNSYKQLLRHILVLSELDITKISQPQEGMFELNLGTISIRLRISLLPTVSGNKLAIRLLYHPLLDDNANEATNILELLHIPPRYQSLYHSLLKKKGGLVLLSGPTGSGKSTLLYALMQLASKNRNKNIITIEDPVERKIIGATQIEINATNSLTYSNILKKLLRQDPDMIVLSEIRDAETANTALESALSGVLILSTIHATNIPELILRLLELSCPPLTIASTVKLISSQRLLRKLCQHCKTPYSSVSPLRDKLRIESTTKLYNSPGCSICKRQGTDGRVAVYEFCEPTYDLISTLSTLFKSGLTSVDSNELENAFKSSMYLSFANSLRNLLIQGTISEVEAESILF